MPTFAQPEPFNVAARRNPAGKVPAASAGQPTSAEALTATGTIRIVLSDTSAIGSGIFMVPLLTRQAGSDGRSASTICPVPTIAAIVVSTAIRLLYSDIVRFAEPFTAIRAFICRRLLLSPARWRPLSLVLALAIGDLLPVEPGCDHWIPPPPRATLRNVTSAIPTAVAAVLPAVPLSAVTVHQVLRAHV